MHRTQIMLEEEQYQALRERARRSGKSMGCVVREILDAALRDGTRDPDVKSDELDELNGFFTACRVGQILRRGTVVRLVDVTPADIENAWQRFVRHADKVYSFTDCTSFAAMDRLGLSIAAAVDPDFSRAGYTAIPG